MKEYSVNEVAAMLGLRPGQIRQAIRDDELDAERDGRDYLVEREHLEEYAADQGIELDDDGRVGDDRAAEVEAALQEHRPSWEAGFRSGFAAGAQEDPDDLA